MAAAACNALRRLAVNDDICNEFADTGGVDTTMQVAHRLPALMNVRMHIVWPALYRGTTILKPFHSLPAQSGSAKGRAVGVHRPAAQWHKGGSVGTQNRRHPWHAQVLQDSLCAAGPAVPRAACALLRQLANSDPLKEAVLARDGLALIQALVSAHLSNSGGHASLPMGNVCNVCVYVCASITALQQPRTKQNGFRFECSVLAVRKPLRSSRMLVYYPDCGPQACWSRRWGCW